MSAAPSDRLVASDDPLLTAVDASALLGVNPAQFAITPPMAACRAS